MYNSDYQRFCDAIFEFNIYRLAHIFVLKLIWIICIFVLHTILSGRWRILVFMMCRWLSCCWCITPWNITASVIFFFFFFTTIGTWLHWPTLSILIYEHQLQLVVSLYYRITILLCSRSISRILEIWTIDCKVLINISDCKTEGHVTFVPMLLTQIVPIRNIFAIYKQAILFGGSQIIAILIKHAHLDVAWIA